MALPLCGLHLAVVEQLVYSNEPESYAGGDFISLASLTRPDRSKERRQTKQTYDYLTEMVAILKMLIVKNNTSRLLFVCFYPHVARK